jgi:hypothetical protein
MRVETDGLGRRERSIHVEPFIEFLTSGQVVPVVPQIFPAMGIADIKKAMEARAEIFRTGYDEPMDRVALRLKEYFRAICSADCETVKRYHAWYSSHAAA